ncbi:UNVERIFIED_CONTAM: hypothetical protein HDU68_003822, partial [Siphonaria sp. JEL0065]
KVVRMKRGAQPSKPILSTPSRRQPAKKKAKLVVPVEEATFTIINRSSIPALSVSLDYTTFSTMTRVPNGKNLPANKQDGDDDDHADTEAHNKLKIKLQADRCFVNPDSPGVVLDTSTGHEWISRDKDAYPEWGVWAANGTILTFIDDPSNPPLSQQECLTIERLLFDSLERSHSDPNAEKAWKQITQALKRNQPIQPNDFFNNRTFRLSKWQDVYKPVTVVDGVPLKLLHFAMQKGHFQIQAYWRALDRYPGGNADMITTKYTFTSTGNENSLDIRCATFTDFDGNMRLKRYQPSVSDTALLKYTVSKLLDTASAPALRNATCHKVDNITVDSDEYNTEWSSQEILLHIPLLWSPSTHSCFPTSYRSLFKPLALLNLRMGSSRLPDTVLWRVMEFATSDAFTVNQETGGSGALVFRLHQMTLFGPQYYYGQQKEDTVQVNPTRAQKACLDAFNKAVGIARPVQWSNGLDMDDFDFEFEGDGEMSKAGTEYQNAPGIDVEYGNNWGLFQPIYLRWNDLAV